MCRSATRTILGHLHLDTITVSVADGPRPNEILVAMAIADRGGFSARGYSRRLRAGRRSLVATNR